MMMPSPGALSKYPALRFVVDAFAKVAEVLDAPIYAMGGIVSGHTLKHLIAALAAYWLLRMLQRREVNDV